MQRWLIWLGRGLAVLFALFISLFALDVFGEGYSVLETMIALMMHFIPTLLILGALVIAWRWPRAGGVAFLILAGFYILETRGSMEWPAYLLLVGPAGVIGVLFLVAGTLARQAPAGKAGV